MAKRTAVIDIGTNSMRLVIYEKTSRFAFHLLDEYKSPVKLGENSFLNSGNLSDEAMDRAFNTMSEFLEIIQSYDCRKTLTIATSALRSAPNKSQFISRVKQKLKTSIKIIDGETEAQLGALAAINLLQVDDAVTMDIGGGSCELARITKAQITHTLSLNLGTIRLRENAPLSDIDASKVFIQNELSRVDKAFACDTMIVIGGSSRAIAKYIQKENNYPLKVLHGYTYSLEENKKMLEAIMEMDKYHLAKYFNESRVDTIREGLLIASMVQKHLSVKRIVVSRAGVRDGIYLSDLLRTTNTRFPLNFNVSVKSLQDRFIVDTKREHQTLKTLNLIFDTLKPIHQQDKQYLPLLQTAARLLHLGSKLNFYKEDSNGFYFIQNILNFGFSHEDKILIAFLVRFRGKKIDMKLYDKFATLLPTVDTLTHLLGLLGLSECLTKLPYQKNTFSLQKDTLYVDMPKKYLASTCITQNTIPYSITFKDNT